jgi:hypothetical protein
MGTTIEKQKAQREGKKVVHIALVEPMWIHKLPPSSILMERDCSKNCCTKFPCLVEILVRGQQELAMRQAWVINKMQCIVKVGLSGTSLIISSWFTNNALRFLQHY